MVRRVGLNYDLPSQRAPSRPARHLAEELEDPLSGVKVREEEANIGAQHTHQGHVGKM